MRGRTPLRYVIISSLRTAEAGGGQGPAWRDGGVSGRRSGQRAAGNGQRAACVRQRVQAPGTSERSSHTLHYRRRFFFCSGRL